MDAKRISVKIDRLGNPTVEAHGFAGVGCADATAPIERALAGSGAAMERTYKEEWNHSETDNEQHDHVRL